MSQLYPFLVIPIFDERPWGVRDLRPVYTRVVNEAIGESWLTWEENRVANGPLAGQSLGDLAKSHGRDLVGRLACYEDRFPLLIKFLFPGDKLSVQVHPDDEGARKYGQPYGKTECWYVLRANPGAQVALGLRPGVTLDEFRKSIEETRAEELLNWVDVYAGDMLYVAAGTVHTIGGGMVLVETQQTSDITYRLYDYGRPRELHIEKGLEAVKLHTNAGKVIRSTDAQSNVLVRSPFFQVEKMRLREERIHGSAAMGFGRDADVAARCSSCGAANEFARICERSLALLYWHLEFLDGSAPDLGVRNNSVSQC